MTELRALELLYGRVCESGSLFSDDDSELVDWDRHDGDASISLNGEFSADELEAMAWWMRNKAAP